MLTDNTSIKSAVKFLSKQDMISKEVDVTNPIPLLLGDIVFEYFFRRMHIVTHMMSSCIAQTISFSQDEGGLAPWILLSPRPPGDTIIYVER